jgi:outer membrane protein OmpA-like peptidoglycan-associated protein
VPLAQAKTLRKVADAMTKLLDKDPGEVFLIEGHTDAVGADKANLVLSDQRASTVASLLSEVYGIPPENMSVQGYGERYLKIRTEAAEQQNRRVAIRRVTSLVRPANVSSND